MKSRVVCFVLSWRVVRSPVGRLPVVWLALLWPALAGATVPEPAVAAKAAEPSGGARQELPRPAALEPAVRFWARVYSEVGTDGGFVHDARYLDVVYDTLRFAEGSSWRDQQRQLEAATARYRKLLQALARGEAPAGADAQRVAAQRVAALWQARGDPAAMAAAAERVRFQRGQADRFRAGVARAGAWRDYIRSVMADSGVPEPLAALPHVESSFDPTALSHADAAGLWQFTASTGRRYMQIDHVVDERLDPYLSTRAAAQLLRHNYEVTESWPLAITAYNHGAAGVRRAVEQLGTRDIGVIAWEYRGRSFGFASRNFYAAFLAALDVEARAEALFGPIAVAAPRRERVVEAPDYLGVTTLAAALGVETEVLRAFNPALRTPVWGGEKRWPRGFPLRVPDDVGVPDLAAALAAIPAAERFDAQVPDQYHRVGRGEALSGIAARYGTTVRELVSLNGLSSPHRIRAGAVLRLPGAAAEVPALQPAVLLADRPADPAPEPLEVLAQVVPEAVVPEDDDTADGEVVGMPRDLGADPSNFDVAADGSIEIQAQETLGHYADWLGLRASHLRSLNGLRYGTAVVVGKRLKLDFSRVDMATFEARRRDYHRLLQEAFFAGHRISGTLEHQVRPGDSLWRLASRFDSVPMWLLRQYNPDLDFNLLQPGATLLVPVLESADAGASDALGPDDCVC